MKIGIVDYDAGNLKSVETAIAHMSLEFITSATPEDLSDVEVLIVPGVGEAASAMSVMSRRGLDELIRRHAADGKKLIGICLGCQLFVEYSDERNTKCLGLLEGRVLRFPNRSGTKVPHMGWNQVSYTRDIPLFDGIPDGRSFYFVHSFYIDPESAPGTAGVTGYAERFSSVLARGNIVAFQFHPEKSGPYGLRLLSNAIRGM